MDRDINKKGRPKEKVTASYINAPQNLRKLNIKNEAQTQTKPNNQEESLNLKKPYISSYRPGNTPLEWLEVSSKWDKLIKKYKPEADKNE